MELIQIGVIHTQHSEQSGTPVQPAFAGGEISTVEVFPEFREGLSDLDGFDRIWLIFGADRAGKAKLIVIPYRDTVKRGVFATRSPSRPNSICMSCVRLVAVKGNILEISEVDILDGSPLYDIKPYIPRFDVFPNARAGWFDRSSNDERGRIETADDRFSED